MWLTGFLARALGSKAACDEPGPGDQVLVDADWSCPTCSFRNRKGVPKCHVCNGPNPARAKPRSQEDQQRLDDVRARVGRKYPPEVVQMVVDHSTRLLVDLSQMADGNFNLEAWKVKQVRLRSGCQDLQVCEEALQQSEGDMISATTWIEAYALDPKGWDCPRCNYPELPLVSFVCPGCDGPRDKAAITRLEEVCAKPAWLRLQQKTFVSPAVLRAMEDWTRLCQQQLEQMAQMEERQRRLQRLAESQDSGGNDIFAEALPGVGFSPGLKWCMSNLRGEKLFAGNSQPSVWMRPGIPEYSEKDKEIWEICPLRPNSKEVYIISHHQLGGELSHLAAQGGSHYDGYVSVSLVAGDRASLDEVGDRAVWEYEQQGCLYRFKNKYHQGYLMWTEISDVVGDWHVFVKGDGQSVEESFPSTDKDDNDMISAFDFIFTLAGSNVGMVQQLIDKDWSDAEIRSVLQAGITTVSAAERHLAHHGSYAPSATGCVANIVVSGGRAGYGIEQALNRYVAASGKASHLLVDLSSGSSGRQSRKYGQDWVSISFTNPSADDFALLERADVLSQHGGNTFTIMSCLRRTGLFDVIRRRVREDSVLWVGRSAGAVISGAQIVTADWKGWDPRDPSHNYNIHTFQRGFNFTPGLTFFAHYESHRHRDMIIQREPQLYRGNRLLCLREYHDSPGDCEEHEQFKEAKCFCVLGRDPQEF